MVAQKCKPKLQSFKHFKQIYILQNIFTVKKKKMIRDVIIPARSVSLCWWKDKEFSEFSKKVYGEYTVFLEPTLAKKTQFCFSHGRFLEFLEGIEET